MSSARASDNLWRMPCEYCATGRARSGSRPTAVMLAAVELHDPVQAAKVAQVLHAAHLVVQQRRMGHVTQLVAHRSQLRRPQNRYAAASRLRQAGQHAQERGLPCSVVAEDRVEPSRREFSADAAQGGEAAELFDHGGERDYGRGVHVLGR